MKTGRLVWGLVIIIVGVLLLAASLGWVSWYFLLSLLQLWPLALVLIGVYLLLNRRQPILTSVLMAVVIVGGVVGAWFYWETDGAGLVTRAIEGPPLAGVTSASAKLDVGATQLTLRGERLATVLQGSYRSRSEYRVEQSVRGGAYRIEAASSPKQWYWLGVGGGNDSLELVLNSKVPWTIEVNAGAASADVDLSNITLQHLTFGTGASSVKVRVGKVVANGARIDVSGGVASYRITLPSDLRVVVRSESGLSNLELVGFTRASDGSLVHETSGPTVEVMIRTGVSSVRIDLD